jgi:hypothetical protein
VGSTFELGTRAVSFRLPVKSGGPEFRITIRPIPIVRPPNDDAFVHSGDIEVERCQDGKQLQVLPLMAWQPVNFAPTFHAQDVNFDGYLDFAVLAEYAGKWGSESWWVYDSAAGRFVQNELTQDLRKLKANGVRIDPKKQEISTSYLTEPWGCGSTGNRYRVVNNRLVIVHEEVPKPFENGCTVTVSDLAGGTMHVTAVLRFEGGTRVQ